LKLQIENVKTYLLAQGKPFKPQGKSENKARKLIKELVGGEQDDEVV